MKRTTRKIQLVLVPALAMGLSACSDEPEHRYSCVDESGVVVDDGACEEAYTNGRHNGMSPYFWYWMGRGSSMGIGRPRMGERIGNFSTANLQRSFRDGEMPRRGGFGTSPYSAAT